MNAHACAEITTKAFLDNFSVARWTDKKNPEISSTLLAHKIIIRNNLIAPEIRTRNIARTRKISFHICNRA